MSAVAREVASAIESDISDRGGLGDEWGLVDHETKKEIRAAWEELIDTKLQGVRAALWAVVNTDDHADPEVRAQVRAAMKSLGAFT